MHEGRRDALAPIGLPLTEKRLDEEPARVAQHRDEQEYAHPRVGDADALLAENDCS
jgi:hypothetical protein